jgi:hypothetical protein
MSTTPEGGAAQRSLFSALVDDAAVFPPGLAPIEKAVPDHLGHQHAWYGDVVGPFLVPAPAVAAFETAVATLPDGAALRVVVVTDARSPDPLAGGLAAASRLDALAAVEVLAVEVPLPKETDQEALSVELLARLGRELPAGVRAWVEVQRETGWADAVARIAGAGDRFGAKLRTGGTVPQAFPSVDELAAFLHRAVAVGAAFKLTAGLHSAVRGPDATGAQHHGVLNVVNAVHAALGGAPAPDVAEVLAETSASTLASAARRLSEADVAAVRASFTSFGCCGVTDPVGDLVDLALIEEVPA